MVKVKFLNKCEEPRNKNRSTMVTNSFTLFKNFMRIEIIMILYVTVMTGCGGGNTGSKVENPGTGRDAKSKTLEAGAAVIQAKSPITKINIYQDGFHFYNGNMGAQMEAHHYAS